MKSSAPWSVKGVERDARETAKEAARREGMTVGEWLNQVIYTASDPASSNGQIEGLKISDLVSAIEHVSKRVITTEHHSSAVFDEISRSLGGVVDRLQRLERIKPAESAGVSPEIEDRLVLLEARSGGRDRVEALKALEKAVGQIALQFDTAQRGSNQRLQAIERQFDEVARRIDTVAASNASTSTAAIDHLKNTVDGVSARLARVERAAQDAARAKPDLAPADAQFIEQTGQKLRVLGEEIKRGGDQIRHLEGIIKKLGEQIDAAERRSAEGVHKVAETISLLRTQISEQDAQKTAIDPRAEIEAAMAETARRTEARIAELQRSFETMLARLDQPRATTAFHAPAPHAPAPKGYEPAPAPALPDFDAQSDADAVKEALTAFDLDFEPEPEDKTIPIDEFDLEDDAPAPQSPLDVLKEVEAAFEAPVKPAPALAPPTKNGADDDIDSILAELESYGEKSATGDLGLDEGGEGSLLGDLGEPGLAPEAPALTATKTTSTSFLQEARRAAKEAAEKAAAEAEQSKRKLTPKQRAILAAKVRRKRLAAEQAAAAATNPPAAIEAPAVAPVAEPKEKSASFIGKAANSIRGMLPVLQKKGLEEKEDAADAGPAKSTVREAAASGAAKSKPVAIALGAAIVLAMAALAFFVKDALFGAKPKPRLADVSSAAPPAAATTTPSATYEVPEPPVIKPRALYLDSVAKLKIATSDADTQAAMKGLEEAAALGHPPAQLQLGELYKLGQGVPQDAVQARAWYERAANGGNVLAMHRMGVMAARGQGGPADQAAAVMWFEKAASLGLVDSQYNLGAIYHPGGEGAASGAQDPAKAYFWYALAAKNGDTQAGSLAAGLGAGLTADQRRAADEKVAGWKAETPDPDANDVAPAS